MPSDLRPYYALPEPFNVLLRGASIAQMALLQTCRQVYTEAVDLLYSIPTFDFDSCISFTFFAQAVPPQRLDVITSLQTCWSFGPPTTSIEYAKYEEYLPRHWYPMCKAIMTMKGLRRLRLALQVYVWTWQDLLLEPLRQLRGLQECDIRARTGHRAIWRNKIVEVVSPLGKEIMSQTTLPCE
ncbi:hypothetical protein BU16DRAFT_128717 [Lophium mytilinum]|uniref:DUF7730 domain-containing protein n=1 Tax=Lophium mytilinum TaxID=390894 RepID=A0A6A6QH94_9PEZI|nr:hypothetical protein BU16DRAFT_128717 [Lophium mytilinum]